MIHPCLPPIPFKAFSYYECGPNGPTTNLVTVDLSGACMEEEEKTCAEELWEHCGVKIQPTLDFDEIIKAGCDPCELAEALLACMGAKHPCWKLVNLPCQAASGDALGAGGNLLECICSLFDFGGPDGDSSVGPGADIPHFPDFGPPTTGPFIDGGTLEGADDCFNNVLPFRQMGRDIRPADGQSTPAGVCARVRLRIEQRAVMTRTAFLGTLELGNDGGNELSGIQVALTFEDQEGNVVQDRFAIRGPTLKNVSDVDGTGQLPSGEVAVIQYTFIPTHEAAPTEPKLYRIGGTLRYVELGTEVIIPLVSDSVTVYPEARLHLTYFHQRDVYSDNPFTPEIEPAEPYALGLLVKNAGAGPARNFRITSAQPQIIENEKGLLIDFKIIGTQIGDQTIIPTLTANLGTIPPGESRVAAWWFTSTLQGKFVDYSATFEHTDALGSANISLIESVEIHELIRAVRANRPTDDDVPDFLVNDDADPNHLPDRIYLSDGTVAIVNLAANPQTTGTPTPGNLQAQLSATVTTGWNYFQLPDPGPSYRLARVVRSDGREIPVPDSAWTTDRSFPESQAGARRENLLHLVDHNSTGLYTLYYLLDDSTAPTLLALSGITPGAQPAPVATINAEFSEPIDLTTFDSEDLALSFNGTAVTVPPSVTVSHLTGNTYRIANLASLNADDGNYELTVLGAGITDYGANPVANKASIQWALGFTAPVVASLEPVTPDPRNTPVSTLDVTFSRPMNPLTVDATDLTLTRDGGPNLLGAGVTVVPLSETVFRIGGLANFTALEGDYTLTASAANTRDTDGRAGTGSLSESWTTRITGPQLVAIEHLATNPRNIVVPSLDVTFSSAIDPSTFDYHDVTLTRDGGLNLITSEVTVEALSDTVYRIANFNWVVGQQGTYTLTVSAAQILDLAGNPASGSVSETWLMDTAEPPPPTNLAFTPDLGASATDRRTSTPTLTFFGQVAETNLAVRLYDLTTQTDLGEATITNSTFTHTVTFAAAGAHAIRARAIDPAGNVSADLFLELFLDLGAPSAVFEPITPNPRDNAVAAAIVTFSEPIHEATFTAADLQLTRDGGANLLTGPVTIQRAIENSYLISGLTTYTAQPGDYRLLLYPTSVEDIAGNPNTQSAEVTWLYRQPNTAPVLDPIPNAVVGPEITLTFTNRATDVDIPANTLRFRLGTNAPAGAALDETTGLFTWTPTRAQAPNTYPITIAVTDDGQPALSHSQTFTVTVTDYIEVRLGETALRAGGTSAVPVHLLSSGDLTNLTFDVALTSDRLTALTVQPIAPHIADATIVSNAPTRYTVTCRTSTQTPFTGAAYIALLNFQAQTNGPSEIVTLKPENVTFALAQAPLANTAFAQNGRAVVVEQQSILEARFPDPDTLELTLHGVPGSVYAIETASDLDAPIVWTEWTRVTLASFTHVLQLPPPPATRLYLRAVEQ